MGAVIEITLQRLGQLPGGHGSVFDKSVVSQNVLQIVWPLFPCVRVRLASEMVDQAPPVDMVLGDEEDA